MIAKPCVVFAQCATRQRRGCVALTAWFRDDQMNEREVILETDVINSDKITNTDNTDKGT